MNTAENLPQVLSTHRAFSKTDVHSLPEDPKGNGGGLIRSHKQGTPASWHPEYCLQG